MGGMALGLGMPEGHFDPFFNDDFWVLRSIHYPPLEERGLDMDELGCGEHTDYGILTMIIADSTPGALQAKDSQGVWVDVELVQNAFVCNIGDMLARWTNGLFVSTPHRVRRPRNRRISVPFFFEPNYTAMIEPIDACCVATGLPPQFPPIMYGDHLLSKTSSNFAL